MPKLRFGIIILLLCILVLPQGSGIAQTEPGYPYYIIQSGDTLTVVAERFGTTANELINLNDIANPDALAEGTILKIPGFEGISGELVLHTVNLGESYQVLTKQHSFPFDLIARLNRLINPEEIIVGSRLIIPVEENVKTLSLSAVQVSGQSPLEMAVYTGKSMWEIYFLNPDLQPAEILAGDMFFQPGGEDSAVSGLSIPGITSLDITPLPLVQGKTIKIKIDTTSPMKLQANIGGIPVQFFEIAENRYVALHGISAVADPGVVSFELSGSDDNQQMISLEQRILVESGYYGAGPAISVDPATILPENTEPEMAIIEQIVTRINPERYWNGIFQYPVDEPCMNAGYGSSRVYNGTFSYYHTGVDFAVCTASNTNVYAAAPGRVVLAEGPLIVRGNAVIIDHGWGVFTGYWHQLDLVVKEGDFVEAGQLLGHIGTTGRSTGYHLHFEVWVNGVQVDPADWLTNEYP